MRLHEEKHCFTRETLMMSDEHTHLDSESQSLLRELGAKP
jgi:hypothetical protein